jgi:hypothetical protein
MRESSLENVVGALSVRPIEKTYGGPSRYALI